MKTRGQSLVEYMLILSFIAIGVMGAITLLGEKESASFETAGNVMGDAVSKYEEERIAAKNNETVSRHTQQVSTGQKPDVSNPPSSGSSSYTNPSAPTQNKPPICGIAVRPNGAIGYNTEVTWLNTSTDPDGDEIVKELWENKKVKYPAGKHTVKLRVADKFGNWSSTCEKTIEVGNTPPNKPVIEMNPKTNLTDKTKITFTAQATDPDGQSVTYQWTNKKDYYPAGSHTVTVYAVDTEGAKSEEATITFTIKSVLPGIVAHYDLNNKETDLTQYQNNGAFKGSNSYEEGIEGSAIQLSGTNYIQVPNSVSLEVKDAVTFEAWIKPTRADGERQIINKEYVFEMALHNGRLSSAIWSEKNSNWTWMYSEEIVPLNVWSHVATVYDGNTTTMYINGKKVMSSNREQGKITSPHPTFPLLIGARSHASGGITGSFFAGNIDQVKVHNIALPQSEIQKSYQQYPLKSYRIPAINNNYWEMVTQTTASGNNEAMYVSINNDPYAISSNTYLQYDLYHDTNNPSYKASVEIHFTDGTTMRDYPSGSNQIIEDMFDKKAHPSNDMSDKAKGEWYRRSLDLKSLQGKTISSIMLADENDSTGIMKFRVANIQFVKNGVVDKVVQPTRKQTEISHSTHKQLQYVEFVKSSLDLGHVAEFDFKNGELFNTMNNKGYSLQNQTVSSGPEGPTLTVNGERITVPIQDLNLSNSDYVTVSFWYRWNNESTVMPVAFEQYDYWCISGVCGFNTGQGDVYGISNPYSLVTYRHTVAVFKKGDVQGSKIYIDGVAQNMSQQRNAPANQFAIFTDAFHISSWSRDLNYLMKGSNISHINIWDRELTSEEVTQLYSKY